MKKIFILAIIVVLLAIKKMNSSESEQSVNENLCNKFLFAKDNRYEWKQLEINGVENNIVTIFDDTLIDLREIKPSDLWEHNFDIYKFGHICSDNLDFHYAGTNNVCKPFFLKIENCCITIRKGNHLKRVKYLEPFSIGVSSILWQVHRDFVEKLNKLKNEQIIPLDFGYVRIDAERLPIEKVTYFRNLIICYEKMEKVTYRNREKYAIIAVLFQEKFYYQRKNIVTLLNVNKLKYMLIVSCIYLFLLKFKFVICRKFCDCPHYNL